MAELAGDVPQERRPDTFASYHTPSPRTTHSAQVTSRNRTRLNLRSVVEALEDEGLDPAVELVRIARDPDALDPETRARFLNELIQYYQPKVKAVEISGRNGGPIAVAAVSPEQAAAIAREYLLAQGAASDQAAPDEAQPGAAG